jgi:hypothetical protein
MNGGISEVPHSSALLFTNNLGQVVFADQALLHLLNYAEAGEVTGEPLFKVLRLEQQEVRALLDRLLKTGRVGDEVLEVPGPGSEALRLTFTGEASYDPSGSFIGADIMLRPVDEAGVEMSVPGATLDAEATPDLPRREIVAEAFSPENDAFIQYYFTTHVKALYVLLSRLVGLWVQNNLDKALNEVAHKNGWRVWVRGGVFEIAPSSANVTVYSALLRQSVSFATNLIGAGLVKKQVDKTDSQMHQGVLVLATQTGLRDALRNQR